MKRRARHLPVGLAYRCRQLAGGAPASWGPGQLRSGTRDNSLLQSRRSPRVFVMGPRRCQNSEASVVPGQIPRLNDPFSSELNESFSSVPTTSTNCHASQRYQCVTCTRSVRLPWHGSCSRLPGMSGDRIVVHRRGSHGHYLHASVGSELVGACDLAVRIQLSVAERFGVELGRTASRKVRTIRKQP